MYCKGAVLAFGALALMVNAAPTDTALAVRSPVEATTTALDVRSAGDVQLWSDTNSLEKRISLGLYTVNLAALGAFTQQACSALFAAPNPLTASVCGASAFATIGYLIASHWIVTGRRRGATIDGPGGSLDFHFSHLSGHTATHSMAAAYALSNSTEPLLVASSPCSGSGCYNYHYHNYEHPTIGTVHKISQRPRGDWSAPARKRQEYADETAYEDTYKENDGTVIYGTYFYWDVTPADENELGNDNSGDAIAEALYDSAVQSTAFENQGYYCVNIIDNEDGGAVPSTGYFDVSEGENMDDPDNEQSYLEMCYDDEFARKRAVGRRAAERTAGVV